MALMTAYVSCRRIQHGFATFAGHMPQAICRVSGPISMALTRVNSAHVVDHSINRCIAHFSTGSTDKDVENLANEQHESGVLAPLTKDTPFKRAFGAQGCEPQLRDLLNAMLCCDGDSALAVTEILNVECKDTAVRSVIFDIKCKLHNGDTIIIELQKAPMRSEIFDRLIGYQASDYREQWRPAGVTDAGTSPYALVPVRMLALLDFTLSSKRNECGGLVQRYRLQPYIRGQTGVQLDGGDACAPAAVQRFAQLVDITIVQLPLSPAKNEDITADTGAATKWAYLLHHSGKYTITELPAALKEGSYMRVAESARYDKMSLEERRDLARDMLSMREFLSVDKKREAAEARAQEAEARAATAEVQIAQLQEELAKRPQT